LRGWTNTGGKTAGATGKRVAAGKMAFFHMKRFFAILLCAALSASAQMALRRAPSWSLYDSNGQMHDLLDYRGKVVVLEMMQTTCPHCAAFGEVLEGAKQKYGGKVAVLAVVTVLGPSADPPDKVKAYIVGHKITYPILFDMGQMQYSYVLKPRVDLPTVYVIDANGYIRADYAYGVTTRDIFEGKGLFNELDRLIK
jgi:peroxiredoxin